MQRYFMHIVSAAQICKSHLQRNHIGKILIFRLKHKDISIIFLYKDTILNQSCNS